MAKSFLRRNAKAGARGKMLKMARKQAGVAPKPKRTYARPAKHVGGKTVIKQEGLGQQTESRVLLTAGRPDSRAGVMKKIFEPSFYNRTAQYLIGSSNTGQQQWSFSYFAAQNSLKKIADFIQTVNNPGLQNQPSRFLLESANLKQTFVNNSTVPVTLRIFHCRQKRDTWFSTTTPMNYTSALNNVYPWNGDPVGAIQQGLAAAGNYSSGDSTPSIIPGAMPHESQIFKDYFAIHKVTEIEMAMGGSHRLETNKVYNKVIDASVYGDTPLVGITGFTEFLVYQAVGSAIHDVTTNTFTTCPVNIGVVETLEYRYTQAMSSVRALYSDNGLVQNVGDTLNQVNPGSGAISTATSA